MLTFPEMTMGAANAARVYHITVKKPCPDCGDRRRSLLDSHYLCHKCYVEDIGETGSCGGVKIANNAHNRKVKAAKQKLGAIPIVFGGYRT